jgi:hypothetical protein
MTGVLGVLGVLGVFHLLLLMRLIVLFLIPLHVSLLPVLNVFVEIDNYDVYVHRMGSGHS